MPWVFVCEAALTLLAVLIVVSGIAYRRGDWTQSQTASTTPAFVISHSIVQQAHGSAEPITTGSGGTFNLRVQDKNSLIIQNSLGDVGELRDAKTSMWSPRGAAIAISAETCSAACLT